MKKSILFLIGLTLCVAQGIFAQRPINENEVPQKVKQNFENQFKKMIDVQWSQANGYMVDFKNEKKNVCKAMYSLNGDFMGSSELLSMEEVPAYVLKEDFGYPIKEVRLITHNDQKKKEYELAIESGEYQYIEEK